MSKQVKVSVLKSTALGIGFIAAGVVRAVDCNGFKAEVFIATEDTNFGTVSDVKAGDEVHQGHPAPKMNALKIEDSLKHVIYINETKQSFTDKCGACCV